MILPVLPQTDVIRGEAFITGPKIRVVGNPTSGEYVEFLYEGTIESIRALSRHLPAGSDYQRDETNPPKATLLVRQQGLTDSAQLSATYELDENRQQKSATEHWRSFNIGPARIEQIRHEVQALKQNPSATRTYTFTGDAEILFNMLRLGQDTFFVSQPVFRVNVFAVRNKTVDVVYPGAGAIYTTDQMLDEAGRLYAGAPVPAPYPAAVRAAELAMVNFYGASLFESVFPPTDDLYELGWLKSAPTFKSAAQNKSIMTVEWSLELWPLFYYPDVVAE